MYCLLCIVYVFSIVLGGYNGRPAVETVSSSIRVLYIILLLRLVLWCVYIGRQQCRCLDVVFTVDLL